MSFFTAVVLAAMLATVVALISGLSSMASDGEVGHADSGHWCQGATWSDDGRLVLQQCATERAILVYRFDGHTLVQDKAATMTFESRPGAIATQHSR